MKKIFMQVLDFPQMVNQKFFKSSFNDRVDAFDSQKGIRCYVSSIYQYVALALFVWMEYNLLVAAFDYMSADHSAVEKFGGLLTTLLLFASAFPIAHLVRSRGESLGGAHKTGMIGFVLGDFVKTNIRLVGEVVALLALFSAFNFTLSFIFDTNLFDPMSAGAEVLSPLAPLASLPVDVTSNILNAFGLNAVADTINSVVSYRYAGGAADLNGDFVWNVRDLGAVLGAYINVMMILVAMYISLAIYGYLYDIISSLIKWIANPSLPISVKNK